MHQIDANPTRQPLRRVKFIEIDTRQSAGCIKLMKIRTSSRSDA